jgi:ubiquinone/menaquinone biosynthesis C-methylase UbiE
VSSSGRVDSSASDRDFKSPFPSQPSLVGVTDGYERWAPTYDHFPNPLLAREERYVLPLLPDLRNRSVLDLACGTGRWLTQLLAAGAQSVAGVDLSSAMLRVAAAKDDLSGKIVRADCLRLPFSPSTFDFAICSFALGHIQDLTGVATELSRVMKPHSDLFVTDLHPEASALGWRTGFRDQKSVVQIHTLPHSAEEILRAFTSADCERISHDNLWLGNAEQPLFAAAGRQHLFQPACSVPAILFCHFKREPAIAASRRMS